MTLRRRFTPLFFFTADGTDGAGGAGSPTPAAGSDGEGSAATPPVSFTAEQQAAINAEVAKQLGASVAPKVAAAEAKARTQWETDLKALADAENQTAEQQANARAEAAEKAANETVAAANKTLVNAAAQIAALTAGANPARVEALLKLADLSTVEVTDGTPDAAAVKTAIDAALKDFPEFKTTAPAGGASGGDLNGGGGTTVTKEQFEAMTYADRVKLHQSHPDIYDRLAAA